MNQDMFALYKEYRNGSEYNYARYFKGWLKARGKASQRPAFKSPKNGTDCRRASFIIEGFTVQVDITPDYREPLSEFVGRYVDEELPWKEIHVKVGKDPRAVTFRSPTTIKRNPKDVDRHSLGYFCPDTSAAEHAAALFEMGFSKAEAMRLGKKAAQEQFKRAEAFTNNEWSYKSIRISVCRAGIELATAYDTIESDATDTAIWDAFDDKIVGALDEAKSNLEALRSDEGDTE